MFWFVLGIVSFFIMISLMVGFYIYDRRYEKRKASEIFSKGLREEIEQERAEGFERRRKFEEAIKKAKLIEDPDKTLQ